MKPSVPRGNLLEFPNSNLAGLQEAFCLLKDSHVLQEAKCAS